MDVLIILAELSVSNRKAEEKRGTSGRYYYHRTEMDGNTDENIAMTGSLMTTTDQHSGE